MKESFMQYANLARKEAVKLSNGAGSGYKRFCVHLLISLLFASVKHMLAFVKYMRGRQKEESNFAKLWGRLDDASTLLSIPPSTLLD
jgi:hypothetical protein